MIYAKTIVTHLLPRPFPAGAGGWARPRGVNLMALCLVFCFVGMATVLWPQPAAAQSPVTTNNPCLASENLTQQTGTAVRGITNQPVISRNGARVVFWSTNDLVPPNNADGNIEIFVKELTGARTVTQLTNSVGSILGGFNLEPSISGDGTRIAFYSDRDLVGRNADGNFEIFLAQRSGSNWSITQVTNTTGSANLFPSISGVNGGVVRIAFASDDKDLGGVDGNPFRNFEIFLATVRNGNVQIRQITNSPAGTTNDSPAINDAGTRIVYTAGEAQASQVFVWDEGSSTPTQLTDSGNNTQPAITADGTNIVYIGTNSQGRTRVVLHTLSADGTESRSEPIVNSAANTVYRSPTLSDDATRAVYVTEVGTGDNRQVSVVLYDLTVGLPVVISQLGDGTGEQPAISGDGTRVSFVGSRSVGGNTDVVGSDIYVNECPLADLTLEFAQTPPATVLAGSNLTLTLRATNNGPSVAQDAAIEVNLTDVASLPANVNRVLPANQCRSLSNGNVACTLGDLNVGQSVTRQFIFEIPSNAELADIEYAYAVIANVVDQNETDNSTGILRTRVIEEAALNLAVTVRPSTIVAGSTEVLSYDLLVTNGGPSQARSTVLTDTLPTGSRLVTATLVSGGGTGVTCPVTANNVRVTCRLGDMLSGSTALVRVQVNALASAPATFVNVAEVQSLTGELDKTDNKITTRTPISRAADMRIGISASPVISVNAGTELTYTVVVTNGGLAETEGVVVLDLLPNRVTFVRDATTSSGSCSSDVTGQTVTCNVPGIMQPGDSHAFSYVTLLSPIAPAGVITNTAQVSSQRSDPDLSNNESNPAVTSVVTLLADLFVDKSVSKTTPDVGEEIFYTVRVRNDGPSQAYSVVITDLLPFGMTYLRQNAPTGTSYNESTGLWTVGEIPVGSERELRIYAQAESSVGGVAVVNTAAVYSAGQPDVEPPLGQPGTDTATITPQMADLGVRKTAPATLTAGKNITYTITVTNAGPSQARNVVVTDVLPTGVGVVSRSGACSVAAGQVTCTASSLNVGATLNYQVVITRALAGSISNVVNVSASTPDIVSGNDSFTLAGTVRPDVPASLTYEQQPPAIATAGEAFAPPIQVGIRDRFGNLVNVGTGNNDTIVLNAYNAGCTTAISSAPISGNTDGATAGIALFSSLTYTRAETIYLRAEDTSRAGVTTACSNAVAVGAADTAQIVFVTDPVTVTAGTPSGLLTVQRQDVYGNPNSSDPNLTLDLTSTSPTSSPFLATNGVTSISQVTINNGSNIASFIYTDTVQGDYTLTVGDGNGPLTDAQQAIRVTAASATQLVILASPPPFTAGVSSDVMTVERRDEFGNPNSTDGTVTLNFASDSSGTFSFRNSAYAVISNLTINAGSSTADFRYRDTLAGTHVLTVSDQAAFLSSATVSVQVLPAPGYRLRFSTDPYTITAGTSTGVVTVVREDEFGNLNSSDPSLTVNLATSSTGSAARFTATPVDTTPISNVQIPFGSSAANFAYYDELAGTHVLTASDALNALLSTTQNVRVDPDDAVRLVVVTAGQVVTAGMPSDLITVERQDQFGNPDPNAGTTTVGLSSSSGTGQFLEAATPATITEVSITGTQASFRYSDTVAGPKTLSLNDNGSLIDTSHLITITADSAKQLVFTAAPTSRTADDSPTGPFTLQRRDQYGNANITDPALTVDLSSESIAGTFYEIAVGGLGVTSVEIANGGSTVDFYYRDTLAGTHVITADGAGPVIPPVTTTINVAPGAPSKLVYLNSAQTITAGTTSAVYVVEIQDSFSNAVTPTMAINAALTSSSPDPDDFLDAPGGNPKTVLMFNGNSRDTFYYTDQLAGQHTLVADVAAFASTEDATQVVTVLADTTDRIVFVTGSYLITAGQVSPPIVVERQDQFGNANSTDPTLTLNLTTTALASGAFMTNTQVITQVSIAPNSSRASFLYTDTVRATVTITVSDAAAQLTPIAQTHTVQGGTAAYLQITGPGSTTAGTPVQITVTARDAFNNQSDPFDGPQTLIFGGIGLAPNGDSSQVTDSGGTAENLGQATSLQFNAGIALPGTQNVLTIFNAGAQVLTATVQSTLVQAVGGNALAIQVDPAATQYVRAETAASGGAVVPAQNVTAGDTRDIYAVGRDTYLNETGSVAANWTLGATGGVQPTDIAPTSGVTQTTFSARLVGTAIVTPTFTGLTPVGTGLLTVVPGTPVTVSVETAANGSGTVVPSQTITSGDSITVYAVTRDSFGNFVANPNANWAMINNTGLVNGDLSPTTGSSTVFTGNQTGTGQIEATVDALVKTPSGVLTVVAGPPTRLVMTTGGSTTVGAGTPVAVTLTAYDAGGNVAMNYTGVQTLVFSGATPSLRPVITPTVTDRTGTAIDFGQPTELLFTNGVASPGTGPDTQRITIYREGTFAVAASDGGLTTNTTPNGNLSITVNGLNVFRLAVETPTTNYTAGVEVLLRIVAEDQYGNLDTGYTGNKNLVFDVLPSPTAPDGTQSYVWTRGPTPSQAVVGNNTGMSFSGGVAQATASENGAIVLFRAGTFSIATRQGSNYASGAAGTVTVTVAPSQDQVPVLTLVSPQVNGQAFSEAGNRIQVQDVYSNVVTGFNAAQYPVTLTVQAPLAGTITLSGSGNDNVLDGPGEFVNGVAQLDTLDLTYTGTAGTGNFVATMTNPAGGTSSDPEAMTIVPAAPTTLEIFGRVGTDTPTSEITVTAGTPISLTLNAYDGSGNLATNYNTTPGLIFTGADAPDGSTPPDPAVVNVSGTAVRFGASTSLQFSSGVVQVAGSGINGTLLMYVPGDYQVAATGGGMSTPPANQLTVHVLPGSVASYSVNFASPQALGSPFIGTNTVTALDAYGNIVTGYDGAVEQVQIVPVSPLTGTVSGLSGTNNDIIAGGNWTNGTATLTTLIYSTSGIEQTGPFQALLVGSSPPITGQSAAIQFVAAPP